MPGKSVPYWNIQGSYLVNLYLLTIYRLYTKFKIYKSNGNVREQCHLLATFLPRRLRHFCMPSPTVIKYHNLYI